ncbi:MAG: sulfite exporter TauE/SafE family protein [Actinobacteria bacterium]|nr:sulfite exporter TauE/SafE family protein [Actinomycetota bacterium]
MWVSLAVGAVGFGSGVLASVLGIGGTVITTPIIRALGASPIFAVGSTVPAILPGALSGSLRFQREGLILWRVALICGGSGMVFAVLGGWVADIVDAKWLMVFTALLVMWCGVALFRDARRPDRRSDRRSAAAPAADDPPAADPAADPVAAPAADSAAVESRTAAPAAVEPRGGVAAIICLGVVGGFLAGLLGIGGGLILTPGFSLGLRLPVKNTIATALAAVAMMSSTALITHVVLGHVDWRFALPLMIGIVPGARLGANITIGASEHTMRLVAGTLLTAVATLYLGAELATW